MDKYISGESVETNKRQTAQKFLDICLLDMETLKLRAVIKILKTNDTRLIT